MERKVIQKIDIDSVKEIIKNSSQTSSIYVGCDSQNKKKHTIFAVAIVIHIDSCKGGQLFLETSSTKRISSMRQRLLMEVEIAVYKTLEILDVIGNRHLEIHLDINGDPKHLSNAVCKEAMGFVTGQGLECKIKPAAFAASYAADHVVRN